MSATELKTFLEAHLANDGDVEEFIKIIEAALSRAAIAYPPRAELAKKARELSQATHEFINSLRNVQKAMKAFPELRYYFSLLTPKEFSEFEAAAECLPISQKFDEALDQALSSFGEKFGKGLGAIEKASSRLATSSELVRQGTPSDERRIGLGIELAYLFKYITGLDPTFSGAAAINEPRGQFGSFVAAAAHLRNGDILRKGFSGFLETACKNFKKAEGKSRGGQTRKNS